MHLIGQRVIEYLKTDTTLINLLGSADNIFARTLNETENRPDRYITVECSPGEDLNYSDGQMDDFDIEVVTGRSTVNSFSNLMDIVERVDDLLNKSESALSNSSWKVIHIARDSSPTRGALIDDKSNEYYYALRYSYILDEN